MIIYLYVLICSLYIQHTFIEKCIFVTAMEFRNINIDIAKTLEQVSAAYY